VGEVFGALFARSLSILSNLLISFTDFDPSKVPKRVGPKPGNAGQRKVRMMVPMTLRCTNCGNFIYKGTKFNSRKETVNGEDYLGIKIFRFYMRCGRCSQELTIKTDPKNADYVAELGCTRNFEIWKEKEQDQEDAKEFRTEQEKGDAMKKLENRTIDSKQEMEILDALEEVQYMNARNNQVDTTDLLNAVEEKHKRLEEEKKKQEEEEKMAELKDEEFDGAEGIDLDDLQALKTMSTSDQYVRRIGLDSKEFSEDDDPFLRLQKRLAEAKREQEKTMNSKFLPPAARLPNAPSLSKLTEPSTVMFNPKKKQATTPIVATSTGSKPQGLVGLAEEDDPMPIGGGLISYGGDD